MSRISTLARLQRIDQQIAERTRRVQQIERELAGDAALDAARANLAAHEQDWNTQRAQLLEQELRGKSLEAKIKELEQRVFGGQVTNPKELDGFARDLEMHKRMRAESDGLALTLMETIEATRQKAESEKVQVDSMEQARQARVKELGRQAQEASGELQELEAERGETRAQVDARTLATYDQLMRTKMSQAIAQLKQGACGACSVTVPSGLIGRARGGEEIVLCPNCGRILSP